MQRKLKYIVPLFFLLTIMSIKNSYGFLIDEVAGSVDNVPVTMNELYFFVAFNRIVNLKNYKTDHMLSRNSFKKKLNIYINRLLILKQEKKIRIITVSKKQIEAYVSSFKKKFKMTHKGMPFSVFLRKYGYDEVMFSGYVKNVLIERQFIYKRMQIFLYTSEKNINAPNNTKKIQSALLLPMLKDWIARLRKHARIEINDNS